MKYLNIFYLFFNILHVLSEVTCNFALVNKKRHRSMSYKAY